MMKTYPVEEKFTTKEQVAEYFSGDKIVCLQCGKSYKSLVAHIKLHSMTTDDYRLMYGLPFRRGLTSAVSRARRQDNGKALTASGIGAAAAPRGTRDKWRASAHQSIRDGNMRVAGVTKASAHANFHNENSWKLEDYYKILAEMKHKDLLATEVCGKPGFPSETMFKSVCAKNPDLNMRYLIVNENLSFKTQARGQILGNRAAQFIEEHAARGLSQSKIAALMGISQGSVSLITLRKGNGHNRQIEARHPLTPVML